MDREVYRSLVPLYILTASFPRTDNFQRLLAGILELLDEVSNADHDQTTPTCPEVDVDSDKQDLLWLQGEASEMGILEYFPDQQSLSTQPWWADADIRDHLRAPSEVSRAQEYNRTMAILRGACDPLAYMVYTDIAQLDTLSGLDAVRDKVYREAIGADPRVLFRLFRAAAKSPKKTSVECTPVWMLYHSQRYYGHATQLQCKEQILKGIAQAYESCASADFVFKFMFPLQQYLDFSLQLNIHWLLVMADIEAKVNPAYADSSNTEGIPDFCFLLRAISYQAWIRWGWYTRTKNSTRDLYIAIDFLEEALIRDLRSRTDELVEGHDKVGETLRVQRMLRLARMYHIAYRSSGAVRDLENALQWGRCGLELSYDMYWWKARNPKDWNYFVTNAQYDLSRMLDTLSMHTATDSDFQEALTLARYAVYGARRCSGLDLGLDEVRRVRLNFASFRGREFLKHHAHTDGYLLHVRSQVEKSLCRPQKPRVSVAACAQSALDAHELKQSLDMNDPYWTTGKYSEQSRRATYSTREFAWRVRATHMLTEEVTMGVREFTAGIPKVFLSELLSFPEKVQPKEIYWGLTETFRARLLLRFSKIDLLERFKWHFKVFQLTQDRYDRDALLKLLADWPDSTDAPELDPDLLWFFTLCYFVNKCYPLSVHMVVVLLASLGRYMDLPLADDIRTSAARTFVIAIYRVLSLVPTEVSRWALVHYLMAHSGALTDSAITVLMYAFHMRSLDDHIWASFVLNRFLNTIDPAHAAGNVGAEDSLVSGFSNRNIMIPLIVQHWDDSPDIAIYKDFERGLQCTGMWTSQKVDKSMSPIDALKLVNFLQLKLESSSLTDHMNYVEVLYSILPSIAHLGITLEERLTSGAAHLIINFLIPLSAEILQMWETTDIHCAFKVLARLEAVRGIIPTQLMNYRVEPWGLSETHPQLDAEFRELRLKLEKGYCEPINVDNFSTVEDAVPAILALAERSHDTRELAAVLEEIRNVPGFESFMEQGFDFQDTQYFLDAATMGPIVIVSAWRRGHAFVVTSTKIEHLWLDFDETEARKEMGRILGPEATDLGRIEHMVSVLEWLWTKVTEPVLMRIGLLNRKARNVKRAQDSDATIEDRLNLPRVWWIGVGPLSQAPFHAAGIYKKKRTKLTKAATAECNNHKEQTKPRGISNCSGYQHYTSRYCISSYCGTIRALVHTRREEHLALSRAASSGASLTIDNHQVLIVTMPTTPLDAPVDNHHAMAPQITRGMTFGDLNVEEEATKIEECAKEAGAHCARLQSPDADITKYLLRHYNIVHFACHGMIDMENPIDSCLVLQRPSDVAETSFVIDELRVGEIAKIQVERNSRLRLAYLSACSSASNQSSTFSEEPLHVVSMFFLAGFSNVIGTMWDSQDQACIKVATKFYEYLFELERLNATKRNPKGKGKGKGKGKQPKDKGKGKDKGGKKEGTSSYFTTGLDEGRQFGCAEALHLAVDDFRRMNDNESWEVPYCWAPFVHWGV